MMKDKIEFIELDENTMNTLSGIATVIRMGDGRIYYRILLSKDSETSPIKPIINRRDLPKDVDAMLKYFDNDDKAY